MEDEMKRSLFLVVAFALMSCEIVDDWPNLGEKREKIDPHTVVIINPNIIELRFDAVFSGNVYGSDLDFTVTINDIPWRIVAVDISHSTIRLIGANWNRPFVENSSHSVNVIYVANFNREIKYRKFHIHAILDSFSIREDVKI